MEKEVTYKLVSVELLDEAGDFRVIYRTVGLEQNHNLVFHISALPPELITVGYEKHINHNFGL